MSNYIYPMNANSQFNLFNVFIFVNRHNGFLPTMPCSLFSQNIVNRENTWFLLQLHILNFVFMFFPMMPCSLLSQNIVNREKPWFLLQLHILYFVFMFLWLRKCKLESIIITIFALIYEIFYYLIVMMI